VAQIVHGKGIDMLLEAARVLLRERDDLVFLIAGPVPEREKEFGGAMLAAADVPPLRGRVRFLGSRKDIPNFLASIDLFVLPTRHEALGIVILEAMAAGLPVIASNVGGIPEMVTPPETGRLVDPIAAEAFTAAIREVLALPDRGKSMGERARHSIIGRFDTATGGQRLKEIYLNVLNLGPRHSVLGPSPKGVSLSAKL
jgi:glycosyltransferase involved in cell wall biosynthesis